MSDTPTTPEPAVPPVQPATVQPSYLPSIAPRVENKGANPEALETRDGH